MKHSRILTGVLALVVVTVDPAVLAQSREQFEELDSKFGSTQLAEIKQLAEAGDVDAQGVLGLYYSNGIRVARDKRQAEYWYLKAAERGHEDAQYNLGQMYRSGDLGRPDYKSALYWYERAAENEVVYAPSNIAGMYYQGMGVQRSAVLATMWMIVARHIGDSRASSNPFGANFRTLTMHVPRNSPRNGSISTDQLLERVPQIFAEDYDALRIFGGKPRLGFDAKGVLESSHGRSGSLSGGHS